MRALAALVAVWAIGVTAGDTERVTRTFDVGPTAALQLNSFSGRVRIAGGARRDVTVNAVRTGSAEQLANVRLDIRQEGSRVVVEANQRENTWLTWWRRNQVVETAFDIAVPQRTDVSVHVFSSPVEISGVEGDHTVHTFSSRVRLEDVAGRLNVHTFSGGVELKATSWRESARIEVATFSGPVDLHVPETARGTAEFHSFSGQLRSAVPLLLKSSSRRDVIAELGGSGPEGRIRVRTFSGDLRIDR